MKSIAATTIMLLAMTPFMALAAKGPAKTVVLKSAAFVHADDFWTPTPEDIQKALGAIDEFLQNPGKHEDIIEAWTTDLDYALGEIKNIKRNYSDFGVQVIGIVVDGQKRIHCNFGPAREVGEDYMLVLDGGYWYWRIEYDMETGGLLNLSIQGYA